MKRYSKILTRMVSLGILAVLAYLVQQPQSLAGYETVHVIDGDTLVLDGQKVRLLGIDAPEASQTCLDDKGKRYGCGIKATKHLRYLIGKHDVACKTVETDYYNRPLVSCEANGFSLAERMVKDGWAVIYRNDYVDYTREERVAKKDKRGVWGGSFEHPRDWKKRHPRK